ncbi:MAG: DUF6760 family protein [Cyanobacteria bacterium P01_C01_bin.118]
MREEVACIAYHFHWSLESILALNHVSRRQWCQSATQIHQQSQDRE